jgi:aconitate hydratase
MPYPRVADPEEPMLNQEMLVPPLPVEKARSVTLEKGPNIASLPVLDALPDRLELPVLLKVGDNISTDEIMPAGAKVLPFRSNIPKIAEFAFDMVDRSYYRRAKELAGSSGHAVVGGHNYGQGSSREHAALAPRFLGLRVVLAQDFARIHAQNLVNFGILPLEFVDPSDYDRVDKGDTLVLDNLRENVRKDHMSIESRDRGGAFKVRHSLSARQIGVLLAGGAINWVKERL